MHAPAARAGRLLLLALAMAALAACSSTSGAATAHATLHLAPPPGSNALVPPNPGESDGPVDSGQPPVHASAPSAAGSGLSSGAAAPSAGASAGAAPSDVPFPNTIEQQLLDHTTPTVRPTCDRTDPFYPDERDSISCGGDTFPFVDYTLFGSVADLRDAYASDLAQSQAPPVTGGACAKANYEDTYQIDEAVAGRLMCTTRTSGGQVYKVIEWTREKLDILGYLWSGTATWPEMIDFWRAQAGPVN